MGVKVKCPISLNGGCLRAGPDNLAPEHPARQVKAWVSCPQEPVCAQDKALSDTGRAVPGLYQVCAGGRLGLSHPPVARHQGPVAPQTEQIRAQVSDRVACGVSSLRTDSRALQSPAKGRARDRIWPPCGVRTNTCARGVRADHKSGAVPVHDARHARLQSAKRVGAPHPCRLPCADPLCACPTGWPAA